MPCRREEDQFVGSDSDPVAQIRLLDSAAEERFRPKSLRPSSNRLNESFVGMSVLIKANPRCRIPKRKNRALFQQLLQLRSTTATDAPRVVWQLLSRLRRRHSRTRSAIPASSISSTTSNQAVASAGFSGACLVLRGYRARRESCCDGWSTIAAEQDHRRCAVAGNVGAGGVDDVGQVPVGQVLSRSVLPNSRFMNEFAVIIPM